MPKKETARKHDSEKGANQNASKAKWQKLVTQRIRQWKLPRQQERLSHTEHTAVGGETCSFRKMVKQRSQARTGFATSILD